MSWIKVVTSEERKSHNEYQFDNEAVIILLVSGTGHGHASIKRIHFQTGKFALGSILCAVIPKDKKQLSAEYLYRFLDLNKEDELVARMRGFQPKLSQGNLNVIPIPLPPLSMQQRIVAKVESLMQVCDALETSIQASAAQNEALLQQVLREALEGGVVLAA